MMSIKRNIYRKIAVNLARSRNSNFVKILSRYCRLIYEFSENAYNEMPYNGEAFVLQTLAPYQFKTIFDVGANVGEWALTANQYFPKAEIHCFEIFDPTFQTLVSRTQSISNIKVNNVGLGDKNENVKIKAYPNNIGLTSLIDYPHAAESIVVDGKVIRGDSYLQEHNIDSIGFLKIDVEGLEPKVLSGFSEALDTGKIDVIQFEYGRACLITKFILKDFYDFLESKGYVLGKIYPNYVNFKDYELEDENFIGPNYLAVRKDRQELIQSLSK